MEWWKGGGGAIGPMFPCRPCACKRQAGEKAKPRALPFAPRGKKKKRVAEKRIYNPFRREELCMEGEEEKSLQNRDLCLQVSLDSWTVSCIFRGPVFRRGFPPSPFLGREKRAVGVPPAGFACKASTPCVRSWVQGLLLNYAAIEMLLNCLLSYTVLNYD